MQGPKKSIENTRSSPRTTVPLEVDVEISGDTQKVLLISRDIGAGGVFLRTKSPCDLWKKVKLSLKTPDGKSIEVSGEVVRRVTPEQAKEKKHPPGIAVAFDEVSRTKRKELISLVLELCSMRESERKASREISENGPSTQDLDQKTHLNETEKTESSEKADEANPEKKADRLLDSMDEVLDAHKLAAQEPVQDTSDGISKDIDIESEMDAGEPEHQGLKDLLKEYKTQLKGDTYYHLLGLEVNATQEQIASAYGELMSKFKPPTPLDQLPKDLVRELSKILGKVRKAFSILSRPDRKRAYDFLIDNDLD